MLCGCAGRFEGKDQDTGTGKIRVVTTIFPPYDFVREIAGDKVELKMLLKPGQEAHSYEPTPQDIIAIENSDIFIYVGGENDQWVEDILDSMPESDTEILRLTDCVDTLEEEHVEGMKEERGHSHDETGKDVYKRQVRIIVDSVKDCYAALGVIHEMYTPIPGRFKDYIAMPKPNMYQSLHTTLMGPSGQPFEIQIRTEEMHKTAEYGIAAHWKYKEGGDATKSMKTQEEEKLSWLRQILEWQRDMSDNREF